MRVALPFVLIFCAGAAPVPKERADAEKVVGTWKMTRDARGNADVDLEIDFHQSGKMVIRQRTNGSLFVSEGSYRLVGTELPYEVKRGDSTHGETLTVIRLTADELVTIDPDGKREEFVRLKKK